MTDVSTRTVLLAGCGDVGTALGRRLAARGWRAVGVRRRAEQLPAPLEGISLDLTAPGDAALPPADAVVITLTADGRDAAAYEHTYLGALRGLHRAMTAVPGAQPRVVLVSSTGVLGGGDGEVVTEATVPAPQRPTAHVLLEAEKLAVKLFPNAVIVRPAGIYGPGRGALVERVRAGEPVEHRRITNRIHRDDLVTVLAAVLDSPAPPLMLHAVDHDAAPLGDVAAHLAGLLGVPVPPDAGAAQQDSSEGGGKPSERAAQPWNGKSAPEVRGKIVDGTLVHSLVPRSEWRYPTYREGYEALLGEETEGDVRDGSGAR